MVFFSCEFLIQSRGQEYISNIQDAHFHLGDTVVRLLSLPIWNAVLIIIFIINHLFGTMMERWLMVIYSIVNLFNSPGWLTDIRRQRNWLQKWYEMHSVKTRADICSFAFYMPIIMCVCGASKDHVLAPFSLLKWKTEWFVESMIWIAAWCHFGSYSRTEKNPPITLSRLEKKS